jgi:hypothetical protein
MRCRGVSGCEVDVRGIRVPMLNRQKCCSVRACSVRPRWVKLNRQRVESRLRVAGVRPGLG